MDIDWKNVHRVLVVRLRSIGDTVLSTPSLIALKRFLPDARIDILLEDWVAPLLDGFDAVDEVIAIPKGPLSRARTAWQIRRRKYDVVFNLHGGTTGTFFAFASGADHRVGYTEYQYNFLYNHLLSSSADFWKRTPTHSAEQQLALLGSVGVPVEDRPQSRLHVTTSAIASLEKKLADHGDFALFHPAAAFETKQWPVKNFARTAEFLHEKSIRIVAVAGRSETAVLESLRAESGVPISVFSDLSLPEITALASRAKLFIGNDSGIAHIAAAVQTPVIVVFGSSNIDHWRPWTDAPNEVVSEKFHCRPCAGYECREFGDSRCISGVPVRSVIEAISRVLENEKKRA